MLFYLDKATQFLVAFGSYHYVIFRKVYFNIQILPMDLTQKGVHYVLASSEIKQEFSAAATIKNQCYRDIYCLSLNLLSNFNFE